MLHFMMLVCLVLWPQMTQGQSPPTSPTNLTATVTFVEEDLSVVAHWKFDDGSGTIATDSSGNGRHGTLANGPLWSSGTIGGAIDFDGSNDHVVLGDYDAESVSANRVTYAAWIYRDINSTAGILCKSGFDHGLTYESNAVWFYTRASGNPTNWNWGTGVTLPLGTWTHVAATYDGITKRLYVNGVQHASVAFDGTLTNTMNPFFVGALNATAGFFNGRIDDVRLYSRALAANEVQALHSGAVAPPPPDMTSPTVTNIQAVAVTTGGATVTWNTNEPATSQVEWGTTMTYGTITPATDITADTLSHAVGLSGLSPSTTYHYRVRSADQTGNLTLSGDFLFTTQELAEGGEGTLHIERYGEHVTAGLETAPAAMTWVDAQTARATNPNTYTNLSVGSHTVSTQNVHGLVESAGTCTYPQGSTACSVTTFNLTPTCNTSSCSVTVHVAANQVTKVALQYAGVYEGFGANVGGRNGTVYHVTNLNDSGPGSLREAVSQDNRYIVFDVGGTVNLPVADYSQALFVCGHNITIDGMTAPSPGITLPNSIIFVDGYAGYNGLYNRGPHCDTRDIIVRGLRIRKSSDGHQWGVGFITAYNRTAETQSVHDIVFDHNSISGSKDDQIGIEESSYHITLSWNILAEPLWSHQNFIISGRSERISIHHNFFAPYGWRNPNISYHGDAGISTGPSTISADVRNNLVFMGATDPSGQGTVLSTYSWRGSKVNFINNYYVAKSNITNQSGALDEAVVVCNVNRNCSGSVNTPAQAESQGAWVEGNVMKSAYGHRAPLIDPNTIRHKTTQPFPAPPITQTDAFTAACQVAVRSGASYRDTIDQQWATEVQTELAKFGVCP